MRRECQVHVTGLSPSVPLQLDPISYASTPAAIIDISERHDPYHGDIYARIEARVRDGVDPLFHQVILEQGACRYLEAAYGNCTPACAYDEFCTADDECVGYPAGVSAGTLTIGGLGDDLVIEPEKWNPGAYFGPYDLPAALFAAGDPITAQLAGDEFPALSLAALGVAPMDPAP